MSENRRFFDRMIELLDAEPLQPFDIRTSDGRAYMVDAPIYLARSRTGETITYYTPEDDRMVVTRVSQIVSLELANRPAA